MKAEVTTFVWLKHVHTLFQLSHPAHPCMLTGKVGGGLVKIASGCGHGTSVLDLVLSFLLREVRPLNDGSLVAQLGVLECMDKTGVIVIGKYLKKQIRTWYDVNFNLYRNDIHTQSCT